VRDTCGNIDSHHWRALTVVAESIEITLQNTPPGDAA
jgi:hypothetical protein